MTAVEPGATSPGRLTAELAGCRAGAAILSAVWLVVAARALSPGEFGDLAVLLAVGGILSVVADAGYCLTVNLVVAEAGGIARGLLGTVLSRRLAAGGVTAVVTAFAYLLVAADRSPVVPLVYAVSILATTVYTTATAALRGTGEVRVEAANEVVSRAAILVVGGVWITFQPSLVVAVAAYALCDVVSAVVVFPAALRRERADIPTPDGAELGVRRVAPLAVGGLLGNLYNRVDVWLLAVFRSSAEVGLYAVAYRIFEAVLIPANAQAALVVRRVTNAGRDPKALMRRLVAETLVVHAAAAAFIALFATPVLRWSFGSSFTASTGVLQVLMVAVLPAAAVAVLGPVAAVQRRGAFVSAVLVSLVVNVAANLAVIPSHGAAAAAWVTVGSAFLLAVLLAVLVLGPETD